MNEGEISRKTNTSGVALEIFGWYGMLAILFAYTLSAFAILEPESLAYLFLNATGALAIALISWKKRALQPALLNAIWLLVAIVALTKHL